MGTSRTRWCGVSVPRVDGSEKVRGATRFVGDLSPPGMWHGAAVRSPTARGLIKAIDLDPAFDWDRVTTVTARDIPGMNRIPIIEQDMPCLALDRVEYLGEPVLLVAAPNLSNLRHAVKSVSIHVQPETPLLGLKRLIGLYKNEPGSLDELHAVNLEKGALEKGFIDADKIVEGEYFTGPQEQAYLETQGVIAGPWGEGMEILGSLQCPFYVRTAVAHVLGLPEDRVKVVQTPTGGAFGGKEDYPSFLASYAALLARKCGRPVRMVLDREEDLAFTPKRHASWTRIKAGVKRGGNLTALEIEFVLDGGAYTTLTPLVLSRGAIHAQGAYCCPNIRVTAKAFRTNIPPAGAFRGFGAPQSLFAIESHMDEVACSLGKDPLTLRRKNVILKGDATATGQILKESAGSKECLEAVVRSCGYDERRNAMDRFNISSKRYRRGLGLALFWHGAGFVGAGEATLSPKAALDFKPPGLVEIRVSNTELGQGAITALSQIVAHTCGIDMKSVRFLQPDTSRVPDSGPTVASRTTMIVGSLLEDCSRDMKDRLNGSEPVTVSRSYQPPHGLSWNEEKHRGDAYPAYSWGAVAVEVSVDPWYGRVRPLEIWCAVEAGRIIHPQAARSQVEGGLIQALGLSLLENLTLNEKGAFRECSFQDYHLPTTTEMPRLHVELIEPSAPPGTFGAKGLGELPMNGLAPAVGNALRHALGARLNELPINRESVAACLRGR